MYNYHHHKRIWKLVVLTIMIFIGISNHSMGFDLVEQISSKFKNIYEKGSSDSYILSEYSSNLVKDPFGDAISSVEDRLMQQNVAGSQYIEQLLEQKGCSISQKKIWGILYYYVPEFRTELARSLKQKLGDYDSKKYVFDSKTIEDYCKEYFICEKSEEKYSDSTCSSEKQKYNECLSSCTLACKENQGHSCKSICESKCTDERLSYGKCLNEYKWSNIMATSPADVMTNCREFFQGNYKLGQENKEILQNVEFSQVGAEKYWNNSIQDSPYDIMVDLVNLSKILYQDVQDPITPVLYKTSVSYKMPNFSNKGGLSSNNASSISNDNQFDLGGRGEVGGNNGSRSLNNGSLIKNEENLQKTLDSNGIVSLSKVLLSGSKGDLVVPSLDKERDSLEKTQLNVDGEIKPLPFRGGKVGGFDEFEDGLIAFGLKSNDSKIFSNLCDDEDEILEPEELFISEDQLGGVKPQDEDAMIKFSELSEQEYQEIVDSMLAAVNQFMDIPQEVEKNVKEGATSRSDSIVNSTTSSELEDAINKIKNCYTSCEGLRIDQKASCMLKCSCSEIESPFFDPNKTPGLGPIFVVRFCGVPATNTNFSIGGKRIVSIEEGLYEIFGVVDKLSREGKLGIWTQQNEFLDSSTKKMDFSKAFSFSIDVKLVDIGNKRKKHTDQHKKKEAETINEEVMRNYGIANGLDNPSYRNAYSIVGNGGTVSNLGQNKSLSIKEKPEIEDLVGDVDADRYAELESFIGEWMDQQGSLWNNVLENISLFDEQSKTLYNKKCGN